MTSTWFSQRYIRLTVVAIAILLVAAAPVVLGILVLPLVIAAVVAVHRPTPSTPSPASIPGLTSRFSPRGPPRA